MDFQVNSMVFSCNLTFDNRDKIPVSYIYKLILEVLVILNFKYLNV